MVGLHGLCLGVFSLVVWFFPFFAVFGFFLIRSLGRLAVCVLFCIVVLDRRVGLSGVGGS